jgi:lipopolysaccharide biosynthesis glycosyltransferase
MKTAIVTAADEKFFGFLRQMLESVERHRPDRSLDICVLDVGLSAENKAALAGRVTMIIEPGWDFPFPQQDRIPRHFQAMFARPQLPQHLPGYERFLWLDADVWLQDWRAVELFLKASEEPVMAIVPEVHQSYAHVFRQKPALEQSLKLYYEACFGAETGKWLASLPIYNAGVWAMRTDLVYWRNWGDVLRRSVNKFTGFLTEQCALNMAIYTGLVAAYPLPAWCNWMCSQAIPALDPKDNTLCSPLLPHEKISIVHQADVKDGPQEVPLVGGGKRTMGLMHAMVMLQ